MDVASYIARYFGDRETEGGLVVIGPSGKRTELGRADDASPVVTITDAQTERRLIFHPFLALGEAYMDGTVRIENGGAYEMLAFLARNLDWNNAGGWKTRLLRRLRDAAAFFDQLNNPLRSKKNATSHYDLRFELYKAFLDEDLQYTCAYYPDESASLDVAQFAKKVHIGRKLRLEPGQRVLELGCGWGGLSLFLAKHHDVHVTAANISPEQIKVARERAERAGLTDRVDFQLTDYRAVRGQFDRVVSIGMLEHVGAPQYQLFFDFVAERLAPRSVSLIHSVGRADGPGSCNPWIAKYIFPGGYNPALSEVLPHVERAGLDVRDIENLRIHYANTLRDWRLKFFANIDEVKTYYDDRFCRMWEFYLASFEAAFRYQHTTLFQMQLANAADVVPLTREYLYADDVVAPQLQRAS